MDRYAYIMLTLALTTFGQLMIKWRALSAASSGGEKGKFYYLVAMFTDPLVIVGLAAAIVAAACWMLVLEETDLAFAYPFMALSFLLVPLAAAFFFNEPISLLQTVGLLMIVGGVGLNTLAR